MKMTNSDEGEDEIFRLDLWEMHLLSDLEKGFVEDESGIFPLEMEKKWLMLSDLECSCVSGEVVSARVSENEDASKGKLVLGEFCDADGTKKVARELRAGNSGKMKGGDGRNERFDLRRLLKIAVIDDTALVEQVPIRGFRSMVKKKIGIPTFQKTRKEVTGGEEEADEKRARVPQRKAMSLHGSDDVLRKQENVDACSEKSETGRKLMYSMKEMEALRFVNVIEQQKFWRLVYDGLGPVAKEYTSLLSGCNDSNQHVQPGSNLDCMPQSIWWERAPAVLGAMTAI